MKITDLRNGNYLMAIDDVVVVNAVINSGERVYTDLLDVGETSFVDYPLSFLKPISITDTWLQNLGFESNGDEHEEEWYQKDEPLFGYKITDMAEIGDGHIWDGAFTDAPCKHVHQLQNLYYALTGNELSFKTKIKPKSWRKNSEKNQ